MPYTLTPNEIERELAMMRSGLGGPSAMEWPLWPHLPVKRSRDGDRPHFGFMLASSGPTVYCGLLHGPTIDLTELPRIDYASFEEAVDAGWIVD